MSTSPAAYGSGLSQSIRAALAYLIELAEEPKSSSPAIEALTLLNDRRYPVGMKKRNHILYLVRSALNAVFSGLAKFDGNGPAGGGYRLIDHGTRGLLRPPQNNETTLVIDAMGFDPEGEGCDATLLMDAYLKGWRRFISFNCIGQRFIGCGLGP